MEIRVEIDDRVRLVNAVLLLTRFAEENARGWRVHPIRIQTLKHLEDHRTHPCVRVSSTLAEGEWMSTFYSFAVRLHGDDGCLELPADVTSTLPPSVDDREYLDLLNDFLEETRLRDLWARTEGRWETVREECGRVVRDWKLADFLHLLFGHHNWKLSFIPNPADPPSFGFGPSAEGTSYAIVGPPCVRKWGGRVSYGRRPDYVAQMAFHEFSHAIWGGIRRKEPWIVEALAPVLGRMDLKGWFPEMYPGRDLQLDELFIRAATTLYAGQQGSKDRAIRSLKREAKQFGIDPVLSIHNALEEFTEYKTREPGTTLEGFLPTLVERVLVENQ